MGGQVCWSGTSVNKALTSWPPSVSLSPSPSRVWMVTSTRLPGRIVGENDSTVHLDATASCDITTPMTRSRFANSSLSLTALNPRRAWRAGFFSMLTLLKSVDRATNASRRPAKSSPLASSFSMRWSKNCMAFCNDCKWLSRVSFCLSRSLQRVSSTASTFSTSCSAYALTIPTACSSARRISPRAFCACLVSSAVRSRTASKEAPTFGARSLRILPTTLIASFFCESALPSSARQGVLDVYR